MEGVVGQPNPGTSQLHYVQHKDIESQCAVVDDDVCTEYAWLTLGS